MTQRNLSPPLLAARWLLTHTPSTRDAAIMFGVDEWRVINHVKSLRSGKPARSLPERWKTRWTEDEINSFQSQWNQDIPLEAIGKSLNRTVSALLRKAVALRRDGVDMKTRKGPRVHSPDLSEDAEESPVDLLEREEDPSDVHLDAESRSQDSLPTANQGTRWSPFWCVRSRSFKFGGELEGHPILDYESAIPFLQYGHEILLNGDAYTFQQNGWQCGTRLLSILDLGRDLYKQHYDDTIEAALSCVTEMPCEVMTPASLCSFLDLTVQPPLAQRLARLVNSTPISDQLGPVRITRLLRWRRSTGVDILVLLVGNGKTKLVWEPERRVHHFARQLLVKFWDQRGGRNLATGAHPDDEFEIFALIDFRLSGEALEVKIEWTGYDATEDSWDDSAEDLMRAWQEGGLGPYLDTEYTEHALQPTPPRQLPGAFPGAPDLMPSREAVVHDRLPDWAVAGILQSLGLSETEGTTGATG